MSGPPAAAAASPRALGQQEHPLPVAASPLRRPCPRTAPRTRLTPLLGAYRGKRQQCASVPDFGDLFAGRLLMGLTPPEVAVSRGSDTRWPLVRSPSRRHRSAELCAV